MGEVIIRPNRLIKTYALLNFHHLITPRWWYNIHVKQIVDSLCRCIVHFTVVFLLFNKNRYRLYGTCVGTQQMTNSGGGIDIIYIYMYCRPQTPFSFRLMEWPWLGDRVTGDRGLALTRRGQGGQPLSVADQPYSAVTGICHRQFFFLQNRVFQNWLPALTTVCCMDKLQQGVSWYPGPAVQSLDWFNFDVRVPGSHLFTNRELWLEVLVMSRCVSCFLSWGTVMGLVRPD